MAVRALAFNVPPVSSLSQREFGKALVVGGAACLMGIAVTVLTKKEAGAIIAGAMILVAFLALSVKSLAGGLCLLFMVQPFESIGRAWIGAPYLTFAYGSLFLILIYGVKERRLLTLLTHTPVLSLLLLLWWALLSGVWAQDKAAWIDEIKLLVAITCAMCLLPLTIRQESVVRYLMLSYVIGSVLCLVLYVSIFSEAKYGLLGAHKAVSGAEVTRVWGVAVMFIIYLIRSAGWRIKAAGWLVMGALIVGSMLNTSRGPLLSLAAALTVTFAFQKGILKKPAYLLLVSALIWGAFTLAYKISPQNIDYRIQRSQSENSDAATSGRTTIWRAALISFWESPMTGVGAGNFVGQFHAIYDRAGEKYFRRAKGAHSVYVQTLVELGVPGIALLGVFLLWMILWAVRLPATERCFALGWTAFIIVGFSTMASREIQVFWLFGLVVYLNRAEIERKMAVRTKLNTAAQAAKAETMRGERLARFRRPSV